MRAGSARGRPRAGLRSGPLRTSLALAAIALLAHLVQVGHFLGVAHEVGPDGQLRHPVLAGGTAHDDAADATERRPANPSPRDEDDDGHGCPIAPPGLEACAEAAPTCVAPVPIDDAAAVPRPAFEPGDDDVLAFAPKHSPPDRRQS